MTPAAAPPAFRCLHCDATPSNRELLDGWCDSCGKRLPDSYAAQAKRETAPAAATAATTATASPPRFMWAVAFVLVVAVVAVVALAV
jgi:hypothetical protein